MKTFSSKESIIIIIFRGLALSTEKDTQPKSWELFYLADGTEDLSQEDSFSALRDALKR